MAAIGRRDGAFAMLSVTAAVLLTACATSPAPLDEDEVAAVTEAYSDSAAELPTVGDLLPLAREGTIGMVDARSSSGQHDEHVSVDGMPGEEYAEWPVVSICASVDIVPTVLVVALPPNELANFNDRPWGVNCDFTQYVDR